MLNGYTLGNEKLSREQFSGKYWKCGQAEFNYQFHTMEIEDGLDERQQLLINNDRALYNLIKYTLSRGRAGSPFNERRLKKAEKAIGYLMLLQFFEIMIVILRSLLFLLKRKE